MANETLLGDIQDHSSGAGLYLLAKQSEYGDGKCIWLAEGKMVMSTEVNGLQLDHVPSIIGSCLVLRNIFLICGELLLKMDPVTMLSCHITLCNVLILIIT